MRAVSLAILCVTLSACGGGTSSDPDGPKTSVDAAVDALVGDAAVADAPRDATADAGRDAITDASEDGPIDAPASLCADADPPCFATTAAAQFGIAGSDQNVRAIAINGNRVAIVGTFSGEISFGGATHISAGEDDVFVAVFENESLLWSNRFGDAASQQALAVALDADGNLYVAGQFEGAINFGGGVLTSAGDTDVFVAAFNSIGAHLWSQRFGDAMSQSASGLALVGSDLYLGGQFDSSIAFGGPVLVSAGAEDAYLAKLSTQGVHLWSRRFGDAGSQGIGALAADASGVVATGTFEGSTSFGAGANLTSAGSGDAFVVVFDADGNAQWARRFGDELYQQGQSVAISADVVAVAGSFQGDIDLGGGERPGAGTFDGFVATFDRVTGAAKWDHTFGNAEAQFAPDLAMTGQGDVVVVGSTSGTIDLGNGPIGDSGVFEDAYFAAWNASGGLLFANAYGADDQGQQGVTVAADGDRIAWSGSFAGAIDLGTGPLISTASRDIFLAWVTR